MTNKDKWLTCFWLTSFFAMLTWSAIEPFDRFTWFLEAAPAIAGVVILIITYRKFKFTSLAYWLCWLHAAILLIGSHYTYARVPLFNWLRDSLELSRNHYDRLGHIAQGFIPAILAREVLLRTSPLKPGKWLFSLTVCFCLAFSAFYELVEWWVSVASGTAAEEFLALQGDIWDTQADMALALAGAVISLFCLSKLHDKQLSAMPGQ